MLFTVFVKYSYLKISLIAIGGSAGIGHGYKPRLQCRLYIIFSERHARLQTEFFHQFHGGHGVGFDDRHQRFDLIADMALMIARIPCKLGYRLFDDAEHKNDKSV